MAKTPYLWRRNGGNFYYRRAYPTDIAPELTGDFKRSLGTDSKAEARRAMPEAERQFHAKVDAARLSLARQAPTQPLTEHAANSLAAEWFRDALATADAMASPSDTQGVDFDEARRVFKEDFPALRAKARRMAEGAGYCIPEDDWLALDYLARLLGRGGVAFAEVFNARALGDYGKRPADPFFAALLAEPTVTPAAPVAPPASVPKRTLTDLIAAYKADRWAALAPATKADYRAPLRLLSNVLGADTELSKITRDDGRRLRDAAAAIPANLGKQKALRGLSVPEAIARGKELGLRTLTAKTINSKYLNLIGTLFGWAKREGWIAANPLEGLSVAENDREAGRDPFTAQQLTTLFGQQPWTPRDATGDGKPIRYWGPLLALFHGLRVGEIAQVRPANIVEREGHHVLLVRGERLKNQNAERDLPLHPELIRLGLLAYVEERRTADGEMLFDGEKADSRGKWGNPLSRWFVRKVKALGFDGKRLGMHSFRHAFEDRLREAGLHGTGEGAALAGRASKDRVAAGYGRGYSTRVLANAIAKVEYPGLHIPGPGD